MSALLAVLSTRAGQTSTYWATSLAWTLAGSRSVLMVDADMEGGTAADLLYLRTDERSIGNCLGDREITADQLLAQAVPVPRREGLRVVPGLRGGYGFDIVETLRKLAPALRDVPDSTVVADLGHPLSHPLLRSPRAAAEAVCGLFQRVFIVIRDDPCLVARTVNVLRAARPAFGEIVVCHQRSSAYRRQVVESLERETPFTAVRNTWRWDERRAIRMGNSGVPITLTGVEKELNL